MRYLMVIVALLVGCGRTEDAKSPIECGQSRLAGQWTGPMNLELTATCEAVSGEVRGTYELSYPTWILIRLGTASYGCNGSPAYPAQLEKLICYDQHGQQHEFTRP